MEMTCGKNVLSSGSAFHCSIVLLFFDEAATHKYPLTTRCTFLRNQWEFYLCLSKVRLLVGVFSPADCPFPLTHPIPPSARFAQPLIFLCPNRRGEAARRLLVQLVGIGQN